MTRKIVPAVLIAAFALFAPAAAQAGSHITWTHERLTVTSDGAGEIVSLYTREYVVSGNTVVFPAFTTRGPTTWEPSINCGEDAGYIVCDAAASFLFQGAGGVDTFSIDNQPELNAIPRRSTAAAATTT